MKRWECWLGPVFAAAGGALLWHPLNETVVVAQLQDVVLGLGVAILAIGLSRDVVVLAAKGRFGCEACRVPSGHWVLCAESIVGAGLVGLGLLHLALGVTRAFALSHGSLAILAGAALVASGVLKDRVVVVRREADPRNVVY